MEHQSESKTPQRIVVIGGNAGGTSFVAQARRRSQAEIIMIERGPHIGYASCGLPYYLSGTIPQRDTLLPLSPSLFAKRFGVDVRTQQEVIGIDRDNKMIEIADRESGRYFLSYDKLVLALGTKAIKPKIAGVDLPNVFTLQTIADLDKISDRLTQPQLRHVTIVGAGFIGLEVAENLRKRNLSITLIERTPQVLGPVDPEIATVVHQHMLAHGVDVRLSKSVSSLAFDDGALRVTLDDQTSLRTGMVILALGVAQQTELPRSANIQMGSTGGIRVDGFMCTSDADIYALGDAVEGRCAISGEPIRGALAGPISRQAKTAADNLFALPTVAYKGEIGTFICKVFDLAVAMTGLSEKRLKQLEYTYGKVFLPLSNHAHFYPGVKALYLKILFCQQTGKIFGAQAVGEDGVDKRIDVIATAIKAGLRMEDLESLPLSYAPSFGAPRDAINLAGAMGAGIIRGEKKVVYPEDISSPDASTVIVDVRSSDEFEISAIPGAIHIPEDEIRARIHELPRTQRVVLCCQIGLKANAIQRFLALEGFDAYSLMGGYVAWKLVHPQSSLFPVAANEDYIDGKPDISLPEKSTPKVSAIADTQASNDQLDVRGLSCPGPIVKIKQRMGGLPSGQRLTIYASDPAFPADFKVWCRQAGHAIINLSISPSGCVAICEKGISISRLKPRVFPVPA